MGVRVLVLLVVGAGVSELVAWSFTCIKNGQWKGRQGPFADKQGTSLGDSWKETVVFTEGWAIGRWHQVTFTTHRYDPKMRTVNVWRAGWPCLCLEGAHVQEISTEPRATKEWTVGVIHVPWNRDPFPFQHLYLPLLPLWPGFALNTLFYAALAWGLWQLPLAIRRRRRSGKGLCVRCGYDLKGIAAESACPECGANATQPRA